MQPPGEQALYQDCGEDSPPRDNLQAAGPTSSDETPAQRTLRPAQQHAGINAGSGWTIKQCASERGVNEKTPDGWVADHKRELGVEGTARLKPCAPRQSRQTPPTALHMDSAAMDPLNF